MKKVILISAAIIIATNLAFGQGAAINTTGAAADNSAVLDLSSTAKGVLFPRLTTAERNNIQSPAHSLVIFNTTTNCIEIFNSANNFWESFNCLCQPPNAVVAKNATYSQQMAFQANWNPSPGATTYYLDASTSATFGTFVSGFNNLNAGNVTNYQVTGLNCNSVYYYRIRAANSSCISANSGVITANTSSCFNCGTVLTDTRDSKTYNTVSTGSQCWMAKNLDYGTKIQSSSSQSDNSSPEKYCYNNDDSYCITYGGLYQWAEMVQYFNGATNTSSWSPVPDDYVQGLCPVSWHIASDGEWCDMENIIEPGADPSCTNLGFRGTYIGNSLKTSGNGSLPLWANPSAGNNSSGFSAMPAGEWVSGFSNIGVHGTYTTITEYSSTDIYYRGLNSCCGGNYRAATGKSYAFSVRCIKN